MKRLSWLAVLLLAIGSGCRPAPTDTAQTPLPSTSTSTPTAPPVASPASPTPTASPASPSTAPASPEQTPEPTIDCNNPATAEVRDRCAAEQAYTAADAELNRVYQQLRSSLTTSEQAQLTDVETTWIQFRDRNCEFESSQFEGDLLQSTARYRCLAQLTQDRTAELQAQAEPL